MDSNISYDLLEKTGPVDQKTSAPAWQMFAKDMKAAIDTVHKSGEECNVHLPSLMNGKGVMLPTADKLMHVYAASKKVCIVKITECSSDTVSYSYRLLPYKLFSLPTLKYRLLKFRADAAIQLLASCLNEPLVERQISEVRSTQYFDSDGKSNREFNDLALIVKIVLGTDRQLIGYYYPEKAKICIKPITCSSKAIQEEVMKSNFGATDTITIGN